MASKEDLRKAPILPNKSAAGVKLGANTKAVREIWGEPLRTEQIRADHLRWEYDCVWFWFEAGRVDQIGVNRFYEGKTKENLGIGSRREEVERVYGMLDWDGTWLINVPPFGIGFDFSSSIMGEVWVTDIYVFR